MRGCVLVGLWVGFFLLLLVMFWPAAIIMVAVTITIKLVSPRKVEVIVQAPPAPSFTVDQVENICKGRD